jgi:hypothetical protein
MQEAYQLKPIDSICLGEADVDYKHPEHVSLNNLALFILKKIFLGSVFRSV